MIFFSIAALSCRAGGSGVVEDERSGSLNNGYTVTGRVRSEITTGGIPGAQVILKQGKQSVEAQTTGADGSYAFSNIEAGSYLIEAESPIYKTAEISAFTLSENKPNMDITLEREWPAEGTLVAGTTGVAGSGSNTLSQPVDLAFAADGNLYIAAYGSNQIRRVTPGNSVITTVAGTGAAGSADNTLAAATFYGPAALCFAPNGDLYIADYENHLIRKIAGGSVTTVVGTGVPGSQAGGTPATQVQLSNPSGLVFIGEDLYISVYGGKRIHKLTGTALTTIMGDGTSDSTGEDGTAASSARVKGPAGLACGPDNSLYFADSLAHKVRKINTQGNIYTVAGTGNSTKDVNDLYHPLGTAVDAAGTLYIADYNKHRVVMVRNGVLTVLAGGTQGPEAGELDRPQGVAIGPDGYLYIADRLNHRIMRY